MVFIRDKTATGKIIDANGTLISIDPQDPGHLEEVFVPGVDAVSRLRGPG